MKSRLTPEQLAWVKIILKILLYALGIIAAALGVDAAAQVLWP